MSPRHFPPSDPCSLRSPLTPPPWTEVFYVNIIEDLLKGPPLMSRGGRILWSLTVLVWWSVAFVIGTAIPGVGALSGLVAAVCIFQCELDDCDGSN